MDTFYILKLKIKFLLSLKDSNIPRCPSIHMIIVGCKGVKNAFK